MVLDDVEWVFTQGSDAQVCQCVGLKNDAEILEI